MIRDRQESYPLWTINTSSAPITTCHGSHGTTLGFAQGETGKGVDGGSPKAPGPQCATKEGRGLMGGGVALR